MKPLSIVCASFVALAALAVTATAATTLNVSKSNTFRVDASHPDKSCTDLKGTVSTDPKEGKICTLPPGVPVPAGAVTIKGTKSNSDL